MELLETFVDFLKEIMDIFIEKFIEESLVHNIMQKSL